jgi:TonB family protein
MFETLLASNVARRPQVRSGLAALFLHLAIVIGAISARATSPAAFKPAVRDTIRLDLSRARILEPRHSTHTPPSTGAPEIARPPVAPDVPPRIPALEPPRFTVAPMNLAALSKIPPAPGSDRSPGGPGPERAVLTATKVDVLPQLTGHLHPRYPEALRRTAVSGEVQLEYVIQNSGRVDSSSVQVLTSSHPAFSEAAREALWKARFTPARRAGRPVAMLVRQTIRFVTR